jgi:streptogrisin C
MKAMKSRFAGVAGIAAATLALTAGAVSAAGTAAGPAAKDLGRADRAPSANAAAYRAVYPQMSVADAEAAAAGQEARKALVTALTEKGAASFGGAWYDAPTDTLHVAVTSPAAAARAAALGRELDVDVVTQRVKRSFAQLEREAAALRTGTTALGKAAAGNVGIDVQANTVVAAVTPSRAQKFAASAPASVSVVAKPAIKTEEDAGCTSRAACDWTVRAGAMLWRSSTGNNVCSVGFTGRTSGGQRYVFTAGHCSNGNGVNWGTGGLSIGPMHASMNSGAVDAALIRVTNSWFTGDLGGEIYHETSPGRTLPVKGVAPTLSYIVAGETVCLSANYTSPNGPNLCGVVGTNSDASVRGMVRVDGLDACGGDSGGGWYWLPSSGNRYAYGLHSRSDLGCHGSQGGSRSWFSAVPTVKSSFAPGVNIEIR